MAPQRVLDRLIASLQSPNGEGCVTSTYAPCRSTGYAPMKWTKDKREIKRYAHRILWINAHGPIPDGLVVDHMCHNRALADGTCVGGPCRHRRCLNVDHMELVTRGENVQRGSLGSHMRTHCKHGHEFTEENTYIWSDGARRCRTCGLDATKAYQARKKAEL